MKRMTSIILCILLAFSIAPLSAVAGPDWPPMADIQAAGGIVMDMDSGAPLFEKDSHTAYPPASITKVMTALVVLENSAPDEVVTFSHDAVYNVEAGSSSAGIDEGDRLTVEDCLYAMLLRSANEAANGLAEHVGGSREGFVEMMNAKLAQLGCEDSRFANPSGLNDENQNVSAYDMALIAREAYSNPKLVEIGSTLAHDLPPTKKHPEGCTVFMEHKMLLNGTYHYDAAVTGKTGYTRAAGNTLVTYAEKDGRRVVAVVLKDRNPGHYLDTRAMLDYGLDQFENWNIADNTRICTEGAAEITAAGKSYPVSELELDQDSEITLPKGASFTDATEAVTDRLPAGSPDRAVAMVTYTYGEREVGRAYLYGPEEKKATDTNSQAVITAPEKDEDSGKKGGWLGKAAAGAGGIAAAALLAGLVMTYIRSSRRKEAAEAVKRQERRRQRLLEDGLSEEEFNQLLSRRIGEKKQMRSRVRTTQVKPGRSRKKK